MNAITSRIISIVLLLFSGQCFAWTEEDKYLATASLVAMAIDYGQTRNIVYQREAGGTRFERNPMLPRHPTMKEVNRHFIVTPIIAFLVLDNLSQENRTNALKVLTVVQIGIVAHNYSIGLDVKF